MVFGYESQEVEGLWGDGGLSLYEPCCWRGDVVRGEGKGDISEADVAGGGV
jgi:hypothetical protein